MFPEFEVNDNDYFECSQSHFGVTTKSESKIIGNLQVIDVPGSNDPNKERSDA